MKFLGSVFFPHLAPWQQKRQTKIILQVILVALIFAVSIAAIMLAQNSRR